MHVALWDIPPADCWAAAAGHLPVERARRPARLLLDGYADLALVPTTEVLRDTDSYCVLPGAALSTWSYPFARLALASGLGHMPSIAVPPEAESEALVARIVLKEHYGIEPDFQRSGFHEARLLIGRAAAAWEGEALDLGQEWFECAGYPMVWAVWVMRPDEATPAALEILKSFVIEAEKSALALANADGVPSVVRRFWREDLRFRLDDLAVASLTKLREYLWYYGITKEVHALTVYEPPNMEEAYWSGSFLDYT